MHYLWTRLVNCLVQAAGLFALHIKSVFITDAGPFCQMDNGFMVVFSTRCT
jgi:hypothetical protein